MKISNIFYSLQGEGFYTGAPTIFIRFYGCNLNCYFCDETSSKKELISEKKVLKILSNYPCKVVTLTGGEPTLNNLNNFINILHKNNYIVRVETNGYNLNNVKNADWITCSPKFNNIIIDNRINEYKIIISNNEDIKKALFYTKYCDNVYIQPLNYKNYINEKNLKLCIDAVLKYPQLKLSPQIHKLIGID